MEESHYSLCCPHEYLQLHIGTKIDTKHLQNQTCTKDLFPNLISHEGRKPLVSIIDAPITDGFIAGSTWPRKAIKALIAAYKKEFVNPYQLNDDIDSWNRIAERVKKRIQEVNVLVCQMKISNLFLLHSRVKNKQTVIDTDSDEGYCYQLMDALLSQRKTKHRKRFTIPFKRCKVESEATGNEQNSDAGCSFSQIG